MAGRVWTGDLDLESSARTIIASFFLMIPQQQKYVDQELEYKELTLYHLQNAMELLHHFKNLYISNNENSHDIFKFYSKNTVFYTKQNIYYMHRSWGRAIV